MRPSRQTIPALAFGGRPNSCGSLTSSAAMPPCGEGACVSETRGRGRCSRIRAHNGFGGPRRVQASIKLCRPIVMGCSLSTKESKMKHHCPLPTLFLLVGACIALPVHAFERVQAGQWTGKTLSGGKTFPTSSCISPHDAQLLNGDAKSVRAYLETI